MAVNDRGDVVVAWFRNGRGYYRLRSGATGDWTDYRSLRGPDGAMLDDVAIDRNGRLHMLIQHRESPESDRRGLHYRTNATGRWTDYRIPGRRHRVLEQAPACARRVCDRGRLAYDAASNEITIIDRRWDTSSTAVIAAARKPAAQRAFPRLRVIDRRSGAQLLVPTSVAVRERQTTVALKRMVANPDGTYAVDGAFWMRGSSPGTIGHLRRLPGTDARDAAMGRLEIHGGTSGGDPQVAAATRHRVVFAWQRRDLWDETQQGIWSTSARYDRDERRWDFTPLRHRTASAHHRLRGLGVDRNGVSSIGYEVAAPELM